MRLQPPRAWAGRGPLTRAVLQVKTASWTPKLDAACQASAATGAPAPTRPMAAFAASAPRAALSRARAVRWPHAPSLLVRSSCSAACGSASTSRCPSRRCPPRVTAHLSSVPTYVTLSHIADCPVLWFFPDTALFPDLCWDALASPMLCLRLSLSWFSKGVSCLLLMVPVHLPQVCNSAAQRATLLQRTSK